MKTLSDYPDLAKKYHNLINQPLVILEDACAVGKKLKMAGFENEANFCYEHCIKAMESFAASGNIDHCLSLETWMYEAFVRTTETEEHYYSCFKNWVPLLRQLGQQQQRPFSPRTDLKKICFVVQTGVLLAHTEVMLRAIDTWFALGIRPQIFLATIGGIEPSFGELLDRRKIGLIQPVLNGQLVDSPSERFAVLRERMHGLEIHTIVWLSVPTLASYALALKLAPRQVFWSVKFHGVFVPEADLHVCDGHKSEDVRIYHGNTWTVSPVPLTVALSDNSPEEVSQYRSQFPKDALLLGSLGREEKINSPEFLSAVCRILTQNPDAHYLWTGHWQPPRVLSAFAEAGIADRCHFIGWVNTNLVAEVLDIFLDTFPFGCGLTGFQAIGHGTPLLSMLGTDTLFGIRLSGDPKVRAWGNKPERSQVESLEILTAADTDHYVYLAQTLIDSVEFRREVCARELAYYRTEQDAIGLYAKRLWKNLSGLDEIG